MPERFIDRTKKKLLSYATNLVEDSQLQITHPIVAFLWQIFTA
jgi:hypothetical protein